MMINIRNIIIAILVSLVSFVIHGLIKARLKRVNRKIFTCEIQEREIILFDENGKTVATMSSYVLVRFHNRKAKKIIAFDVRENSLANSHLSEKIIKLTDRDVIHERYFSDLLAGMFLHVRKIIKMVYGQKLMNINILLKTKIDDDEIKFGIECAIKNNKTLKKLMNVSIVE